LAQRIRSRNPASLEPLEEDTWPDELKISVLALNDLLARVKDAFEREQLFIDAAAHEMRTPVAGIQLHLQNAANTTDPAVRDQALKDALEGVRRTTRLIEQMLTLSRTSHAKASGTAASYAMFDVICTDVVQALQRQLVSRGQAVVIDSDKGVVVQAMPHQLTSIAQNLLENAAKYGDADCTIELTLRDGPDHVTLVVANQGKAIPAAERERIFRPHYRAPASEGSGMDGCGLGLAIVQETVQQLGGHITLTDRTPGEGACFTVNLPVVAAGAISEEV
jgi:two-component system, OmpR family, sensor histidine kinase QseC